MMHCDVAEKRLMSICVFAGAMLTALLLAAGTSAQAQGAEQKTAEAKPVQMSYEVFYLTHAYRVMDLNDIQTDLRNMLPRARIYGVPSQSAISVQGSAEDLALAQKMIAELDKQRPMYRLIYTITELENGKRMGSEHFAVVVSPGGRATVKQGSRVPIVTGMSDADSTGKNRQVQYVDVGLNIEATLDGDSLHSKIEQSSVPDVRVGMSAVDPVIQQTVLDVTSHLAVGKTLAVGSVEVVGGGKTKEIEVAAELVQ